MKPLSPLVILLCLLTCTAKGQDYKKFFNDQLHEAIDQVKEQFVPTLNETEKEIYEKIIFKYPSNVSSIDTPHATFDHKNRPTVSIGVGYYRLLLAVADLNIISLHEKKDLLDEYFSYLMPIIYRNQIFTSSPPEFAQWPSQYYGYSADQLLQLKQNPEYSTIEAQVILGALFFIYAHEVAHHVLGHTSNPNVTFAQRRQMEAEADAWACDKMVEAGWIPIGGVYALALAYYLDQEAIHHEHERKHPAEVKRFKAFIVASKNSLEKFSERIEQAGMSISQLEAQLETLEEYLVKEIGGK